MDSQNVENIEILTPHSTGQFAKLDAKLSAILEKMDQQSKLTEELLKKVDRQTTELVALRSEVASIKTKVCGEMTRARAYLPLQPFKQLEEFLQFEQTLQDEGVMKNIILDLVKASEVRKVRSLLLASTVNGRGSPTMLLVWHRCQEVR
ncbi:hypothetical protein ACLKA6_001155 [Drosophila palustris]